MEDLIVKIRNFLSIKNGEKLGSGVNIVKNMLFDQSKDAIVVCDSNGSVIYHNEAAADLFGDSINLANEPDLPSYNVIKYHGDGVTPFKKEDLPLNRSLQGVSQNDIEMLISYGYARKPIFLSVSCSPIVSDDKVIAGLMSIRDMNRRKNQNLEYQIISAELEEKNSVLLETEAKLRASNNQLLGFAMRVAHDLKVPLTPIKGYAKMLVKKISDSKQKDWLLQIHNSCDRMQKLINDLLEFSKFDPGKIKSVDIKLLDIAKEALQFLGPNLNEIGAEFSLDPLPIVRGDQNSN